jgi:hypothetical protein
VEHLDEFNPQQQADLIEASLKSSLFGGGKSAMLGGTSMVDLLNRLPAEHRERSLGSVAVAEMIHDPTVSLTLSGEMTDPAHRKEVFEAAGWMSALEPRLLESQMLAAQGNPADQQALRFAFACGTTGPWSSPHESICKAASFLDPALRHDALAINLAIQKDPDVRALTFAWLKDMPAGTVDKTELAAALLRVQPQMQNVKTEQIPTENFEAVAKLLQQLP